MNTVMNTATSGSTVGVSGTTAATYISVEPSHLLFLACRALASNSGCSSRGPRRARVPTQCGFHRSFYSLVRPALPEGELNPRAGWPSSRGGSDTGRGSLRSRRLDRPGFELAHLVILHVAANFDRMAAFQISYNGRGPNAFRRL